MLGISEKSNTINNNSNNKQSLESHDNSGGGDDNYNNTECTNSRKNEVNSMYVNKNGYYFDILPFC